MRYSTFFFMNIEYYVADADGQITQACTNEYEELGCQPNAELGGTMCVCKEDG